MPPLYNAYEAKLLNVLHSKLCKENLSSYLPNLLNIHSSKNLIFFSFSFLFLLSTHQNILSKYPLKDASLDFKTTGRQRKDMFH
jgi:hypothetical protein